MQTLNLKLEQVNGNEMIFREGKALEVKPPEKIQIDGDIRTVAEFVNKRKGTGFGYQFIDQNKAVVKVNKEELSITLLLDPENFYGAEVSGSLQFAPELEQFCINKTTMFNREQLVKLLRFSKIWFDSADVHETVLKAYQSFTAEVKTNIDQSSDTRGNRGNSIQKTVSTNIPKEFFLNIPIFKGSEKRKFLVEICIDSSDGATRFWFESVELAEIIQIESEAILNKQLEACQDYVIVWE